MSKALLTTHPADTAHELAEASRELADDSSRELAEESVAGSQRSSPAATHISNIRCGFSASLSPLPLPSADAACSGYSAALHSATNMQAGFSESLSPMSSWQVLNCLALLVQKYKY